MKFLKTLRFDPSDTHVFEHAAAPDEWAVPGTFLFQSLPKEALKGKVKQAFANGFLSIESFGFSTFTSVAEIDSHTVDKLTDRLIEKFLNEFGAPNREVASEAASGELKYVVEMCSDIPVNTVLAVKRELGADGGIRESFSLVEPKGDPVHTKVWEILD